MYGRADRSKRPRTTERASIGATQLSRGRSGDGAGFNIAVVIKVGTVGTSARGRSHMTGEAGNIYVGIGGWTFAPWRGVFCGQAGASEEGAGIRRLQAHLDRDQRHLLRIAEAESFRKWAREVPDGFIFSLKGPRFATNRRVLAEAGDSVKRFYGPVCWNWATGSDRCCGSLRPRLSTSPISASFSKSCRGSWTVVRYGMWSKFATTASAHQPLFRSFGSSKCRSYSPKAVSGHRRCRRGFRLCAPAKGSDEIKTCYPPKQLDAWAKRFQCWATGRRTEDLPRVGEAQPKKVERDVFAYVIHEGRFAHLRARWVICG